MDNQDRNSENLDPKLGSWQWFVSKLKDQRGFVGTGGDGGDDGGGDDGDGGDNGSGGGDSGTGADKGTGTATGVIDLSTIDFTKLDWSKANWKGEFSKDPSMEKHKDIYSVIKANKELEKFVGMDKLPMPAPLKEGATEKEKAQYNETMGKIYARLGRPEAADKYDINEIKEQIPQVDNEFLTKFQETSFKHGASNELLKAQLKDYAEWEKQKAEKWDEFKKQSAADAITVLKKDWGTAFDERTAVSQKGYVAAVNAVPGLKELFGDKDDPSKGEILGNNSVAMKLFHFIGSSLSEDVIAGKAKSFTSTPEEAKQKIQELRVQQIKVKAGSPEYKLLQEQIDVAYKVAYPDLAANAK